VYSNFLLEKARWRNFLSSGWSFLLCNLWNIAS